MYFALYGISLFFFLSVGAFFGRSSIGRRHGEAKTKDSLSSTSQVLMHVRVRPMLDAVDLFLDLLVGCIKLLWSSHSMQNIRYRT